MCTRWLNNGFNAQDVTGLQEASKGIPPGAGGPANPEFSGAPPGQAGVFSSQSPLIANSICGIAQVCVSVSARAEAHQLLSVL